MERDHPKSVLIPFKVIDGRIRFLYGGDIPAIRDGAVGELSVSRESVLDKEKLEILERETKMVFFPEGEELLAQVNPNREFLARNDLRKHLEHLHHPQGYFVRIRLKSPLHIKLRGTKLAELDDCPCEVPALPDQTELVSVNQTYTVISEAFEPHRRSHTGNVFKKLFAQIRQDHWVQLEHFRENTQAEYENELLILNQKWWYKAERDQGVGGSDWAFLLKKGERDFIVRCLRQMQSVYADFYFRNEADAIGWLRGEGYEEYRPGHTPRETRPPVPPFRKQSGEVVDLLDFLT